MEQLLAPFLIAFIIALIATPIAIKLAFHFGFVDDPRRKHPAILHKRIVARAGGLPLFLAITIGVWLFLPISQQLIGIIIASLILVAVGLLDDKYDLSPFLRLATNILAAVIVVWSGVGISYITNPFPAPGNPFGLSPVIQLDQLISTVNFLGITISISLANILAVIWIVWVINMLNWSAGVDGQMPGIVIIAAIFLTLVAWRFAQAGDVSQVIIARLSMIVAGATSGFLIFNWHPAKIFPGYGATILGLFLAVLAIFSDGKVATAILVMGIPTADAVFTIIRRISTGKSPFRGDRGHLHHLLLGLGWGHQKIALFYWLLCVILGWAALNLDSRGKIFAIVVVAIAVGGSILWLTRFTLSPRLPDQDNG
ncbi:undecaprenyl/decaprenyl-phosphate alpha-N-acetylglucosaminyl 1-phosphate transferase [Candidatus Daviesbacteria bacterium]|nr:undecaprenyl/decaprenyl-phosphate alpha-N-acetylglucosaminyl 1-phosphate transferase [Candidatus Daviesbacteria bacterium]